MKKKISVTISKDCVPLLKEAIKEATRNTYVSNSSIEVFENGVVEFEPTNEAYLLEVGRFYGLLQVKNKIVNLED